MQFEFKEDVLKGFNKAIDLAASEIEYSICLQLEPLFEKFSNKAVTDTATAHETLDFFVFFLGK